MAAYEANQNNYFKPCYDIDDVQNQPIVFLYGVKALNDDTNIQQNASKYNLADLFTKVLPTLTFEKLKHNIEM